jgi:hypothetical protein
MLKFNTKQRVGENIAGRLKERLKSEMRMTRHDYEDPENLVLKYFDDKFCVSPPVDVCT